MDLIVATHEGRTL